MNALPLIAAGVAVLLLSGKKKSTKKSNGNGNVLGPNKVSIHYGPDYGKGTVGGNYRLAVVQSERCGTCAHGNALHQDYPGTEAPGGADRYCSYWKTGVRADYVCDAFEPK